MPTFDFTCTACKTVFEKTVAFGSKTKPACPECGSKKTEKMISMPSVVFKGSGFYKTDSKASPAKKTPEAVKQEPDKKVDAVTPPEKKTDTPKKADTTKP